MARFLWRNISQDYEDNKWKGGGSGSRDLVRSYLVDQERNESSLD